MAGWGNSGGKITLPPGTHVHYINGVKATTGKNFDDPTQPEEQFEFDCQYQIEGTDEWKSRKIWTKRDFMLWDTISTPNMIPKIMKLVKACGLASPQTRAEAEAWDPTEAMTGQYFRVRAEENELDKFVTMEGVAPGPGTIGGKKKDAAAPKAPPAPPSAPKTAPKAPPPPPVPADAAAAVTGADEYE